MCWNQEVFLGIFCYFEAKEVFFVRSFTSRVKNSAKSGGQRIKRGGCPFITRIHLDTWNNKTRGRASQRFPFGPWPFVAVNNLAKASVAARLNREIYQCNVFSEFTMYISGVRMVYQEIFIFRVLLHNDDMKIVEYFAIARILLRREGQEVDDKREDVSRAFQYHTIP